MDGYKSIEIHRRMKPTGQFALVSDVDFEAVSQYRWGIDCNGYVYRDISKPRKKRIYLHRFVTNFEFKEVDHINRDKLDNRRENLRPVTHQQNMENAPRTGNYTSKYRGVSWDSSRGKWVAKATINGKQHHLGRYKTEEDANQVVTEWRRLNMAYSNEGAD